MEKWKNTFNQLFPTKESHKLQGKVQNYNKCVYYSLWIAFLDHVDEDALLTTRQRLHKLICSMYWLPAVKSDRIWSTKPESMIFKTFSTTEEGSPAPQIFICPTMPDPK